MFLRKFSKNIILIGILIQILDIGFVRSNINYQVDGTRSNIDLNQYIKKIPNNNFYILGSGDVLDIKIGEGTAELDRVVTVDGEGVITLKRLNRIYVSGLTLAELIEVLNKAYSKYVNEINVEVTILQYRTVTVFIDGEVETPGLHAFLSLKPNPSDKFLSAEKYEELPNLINALRKSEGVTTNADLSNIEVTRVNSFSNGGGRIKANINLLDALNLKDNNQNIRLYDGDTIKVGKSKKPVFSQISKAMQSNINPKYINVFVGGRVNREGQFKVGKTAVLTDAVDIAGGAKILKGPVSFLRVNPMALLIKGNLDLKKILEEGVLRIHI